MSLIYSTMTEKERWEYLVSLDEELLKGGILLSEWCVFIVKEADTAFAKGAFLASILTAVSAIETYLRSEYSSSGKERLVDLINSAQLDNSLQIELHELRKYRNKWVHVDSPWDDDSVIKSPEMHEAELERMAFFAARVLRKTIYENPWI